jgi:hypothetical protein
MLEVLQTARTRFNHLDNFKLFNSEFIRERILWLNKIKFVFKSELDLFMLRQSSRY